MRSLLLIPLFLVSCNTIPRETPSSKNPVTTVNQGKPVKVTREFTVSRFSFNTDKSKYSHLSGSHQNRTATGIGNGGTILGYTIPLNSSLKRVKEGQRNQAAILTFTQGAKSISLLAVANDTGGIHINGDSRNRGWGELGINTWLAAQKQGLQIKLSRNRLSTPGVKLKFQLLDYRVKTVSQYKRLTRVLRDSGQLR